MLGFLNRNLYPAPQNSILTRHLCYHQWITVVQSGTLILKVNISKLEILQHRAARFVANKPWYRHQHNVSITKILSELHWPTLENCRKQARLILMFKIVNGNLTVPARCLPPPPTITCTCANHSLKYAHLQSNLDIAIQILFLAQNDSTME